MFQVYVSCFEGWCGIGITGRDSVRCGDERGALEECVCQREDGPSLGRRHACACCFFLYCL